MPICLKVLLFIAAIMTICAMGWMLWQFVLMLRTNRK